MRSLILANTYEPVMAEEGIPSSRRAVRRLEDELAEEAERRLIRECEEEEKR